MNEHDAEISFRVIQECSPTKGDNECKSIGLHEGRQL